VHHRNTSNLFNIPFTDGAGFIAMQAICSIFFSQMALASLQCKQFVQYSFADGAGFIAIHALCSASVFLSQIVSVPSQYKYCTFHLFNIPHKDVTGFIAIHAIWSTFYIQMVLAPSPSCNLSNIPPTESAGSITVPLLPQSSSAICLAEMVFFQMVQASSQ
jgi:hypothetical protein